MKTKGLGARYLYAILTVLVLLGILSIYQYQDIKAKSFYYRSLSYEGLDNFKGVYITPAEDGTACYFYEDDSLYASVIYHEQGAAEVLYRHYNEAGELFEEKRSFEELPESMQRSITYFNDMNLQSLDGRDRDSILFQTSKNRAVIYQPEGRSVKTAQSKILDSLWSYQRIAP